MANPVQVARIGFLLTMAVTLSRPALADRRADATVFQTRSGSQLYGEIGAEGAAIAGGDPDGLFIFAEVEEGSVYGAVFKDEGKRRQAALDRRYGTKPVIYPPLADDFQELE